MKRLQLTLVSIQDETHDSYSLYLQPQQGEPLSFLPGQYLSLIVSIDGIEHRRAFSLSSPPSAPYLRCTIKRIPGGLVSNYLREKVPEGSTLKSLAPMGNFTVSIDPAKSHHYILIGAGSGISPLFSILKTVLAEEPLSQVSLWLGNRTEGDIIFKEELLQLKKTYKERLNLTFFLSQAPNNWKGGKGRLDKDAIYGLISDMFMVDVFRKSYYLCGPKGMMEAVRAAMDKHAINPAHVFQELFVAPPTSQVQHQEEELLPLGVSLPRLPAIEPQMVKVLLDEKEHQLEVPAKENILKAAIAQKLDPPYACQAGICTACRAKLHKGTVHMLEDSGLSDEELLEGYILTCQAYPTSTDVEIEFT